MPVFMPARNRSSIRIFENPVLEALSKTPPALLAAFWLPGGAGAIVYGASLERHSAQTILLLGIAAIVAWTLLEYAMHRFVFHFQPRGPITRRFVFVIHGCHHVDPRDPLRNVMPLSVTIPYAAVNGLIVDQFFALGDWLVFGGFFALAYAGYDLGHWAFHQRTSSNRLFRYLQRHHLRHHYARADGNYAVTAPVWDRVFGTRIAKSSHDSRRPAAGRSAA